jgi:hypothetical protein
MPSASSPGTDRIRHDPVRITSWALLGVIALLEVILSAIPLAPRIAGGLRATEQTHEAQDLHSTDSAAAVSSPGLQATKTTGPLSETVSQSPVLVPSDLPARQPPPDSAMPGGALLQIVSDHLESSGGGQKKLQIAIKAAPRETIQVSEVKVQVYFYDEENGEIAPSKAQVTSSWLSLPVNWKKGTPELLEVSYLPDSADGSTRFAGYLVAIYYKGDLQDCRANPPRLKKMFEPKYFIGNEEP